MGVVVGTWCSRDGAARIQARQSVDTGTGRLRVGLEGERWVCIDLS